MQVWEYTFFISCFVILYNYAGYAVLAWVLNAVKKRIRPRPQLNTDFLPTISFVVAAFNEEDCIGAKLINSLEQDYPTDRIEYIFITDGSTDGTAAIVQRYPSIRHLHEDARRGKSAALNRAVMMATNEILIFSDANTFLNKEAVRNIARHYSQPKVGGVAGEKKVISPAAGASPTSPGATQLAGPGAAQSADPGATPPAHIDKVGSGEGLYWKYESFLKRVDSEFYSVVGAAGELFSLRRVLYDPLPHSVILDDFVISLRTAAKGYRIIYEPDAYAMELPSFSLGDEHKRKVRIAAGGFQAIGLLYPLLFFWKQPALSFLYISHRVLRWTLSPLCFILAFVSNAVLVFLSTPDFRIGRLFTAIFIVQCLFYLLALAGKFAGPRISQSKMVKLPYYFVFMNVSVIQGFFRFLKGRQAATWEKARRLQTAAPSRPLE
jgi:poly-beta-1,6-N-acetyl-D-glucosamine synthase